MRGNHDNQLSFTGRIARAVCRLAIIPLTLAVLFYGALTVWWWSGEIRITRDVVGELVERSARDAGPDPAWPGVVEVMKRVDPALPRMIPAHPAQREWEEWRAAIAADPALAPALRRALDYEHLGILASTIQDTGDGRQYRSADPLMAPTPIATSYDLIMPLFDITKTCWRITTALSVDAWRAADEGDAETAAADCIAMIRLAEQSRETSLLFTDLYANGHFNAAVNQFSWIAEAHPDLFDDEHLARIRDAIAGFEGGWAQPMLADERAFTDDLVQRLFTDNGSGDGHAIAFFPEFGLGDDLPLGDRRWSLPGPAWLLIAPSRKEFAAMAVRFDQAMLHDITNPAANQRPGELSLLQAELDRTWVSRSRWHIFLGSFAFSILIPDSYHHARDVQSGALTALAIQRFRRNHNRWPATLAELVPEFCASVPIDRHNGQPLIYRIDPDSGAPVLYSVGSDRIDNGGTPLSYSGASGGYVEQGDLVFWPVPPPQDDPLMP
ncbi:MAG: hypothetical protein H6813_07370 [Phycisphaeraceae bacterium]|nr:hypothetical protein [Phycisphaeraceae bacterium]MCB9848315.1 hypothetical protein [Phycisphaeraceae bacterium]